MRVLLQQLRNGQVSLAEAPCPRAGAHQVLVRTSTSLISAGTERMLVSFGRANLLDKARQQPDRVRQALEKARTDGWAPTLAAIRDKLDKPIPLGYSNVGVVLEAGTEVPGFVPGDRVVSNGNHAEVVQVPGNLCAAIPDNVTDEQAAFTVLGAIALQGIRLAAPTLGECFAVTGLGLIGLMAVQMLKANGCRVIGIDFNPKRLELARRFGAETVNLGAGEDPVAAAERLSGGVGLDGVLVAASTASSDPMHQAALMCRKKGRIVLVGVSGLELARDDFYKKELTFQVSCAYGPGRYDAEYEQRGQDYPLSHVRWTAQRNFEAVLGLMAEGRLDIAPLVSDRFDWESAPSAYDLLEQGSDASLGILLRYPAAEPERLRATVIETAPPPPAAAGTVVAGFVGAGNYAGRTLMPAFQQAGAVLHSVASESGVSAATAARKFGFRRAASRAEDVIADGAANCTVIATRHDSHARHVIAALEAGKHVFVEKPLAVSEQQLRAIESAYRDAAEGGRPRQVMVGFNRRFAPQVRKMKSLLAGVREPKAIVITVNAGQVPSEHWTQDPRSGGGRILGEACHFIDLARFLAGERITAARAVAAASARPGTPADTATLTLEFEDGSLATVHYFANGHRAFPKERLEVFCGGRILQLDNFRKLTGYGWHGFRKLNLWSQDKGNQAAVQAFVDSLRNGTEPPIPWSELVEVSRVTIQLAGAVSPGLHAAQVRQEAS